MTIHAFLVALIGFVILCIGLAGTASPTTLVRYVSNWRSTWGIVLAGALRILFGVTLWLSAADSHAPAALRVLGVLSFVAGCALPVIGLPRFTAILGWWAGQSPAIIRCWGLGGAVFGAFTTWAVIP